MPEEIPIKKVDPIWPWMQQPFGDWLFSGFSQKPDGGWDLRPMDPYPGQLTPDINQTRLPDVWGNWQPWDGGTMHLANMVGNNGLGIGQYSPLSQQMMQYGGMGGAPHDAMSLLMQYGAPSQAGQYMANMAQFGMASPGSGGALANFAQGNLGGAAQYLAPFLTGQMGGNSYQPPMIQPRQITRQA